jgi:SAM-dependent methyltransferase
MERERLAHLVLVRIDEQLLQQRIARIVPECLLGTVVGVDRAEDSLAKARERVTAERLLNVSFLATDLADPRIEGTFDAIVGRFILMFLADPVETLKRLATRLRPGGTIVFQEPSWASFFPLATHLPLYTRCGELLCETLRRTGARPDMPAILHRGLLAAGLTEPQLRVEVVLATRPEERRWVADLLVTMQPRIAELRVPLDGVGDLDTVGTPPRV